MKLESGFSHHSRILLLYRQDEADLQAACGHIVGADLAALGFDPLSGNGQAKDGSPIGADRTSVITPEPVKDPARGANISNSEEEKATSPAGSAAMKRLL